MLTDPLNACLRSAWLPRFGLVLLCYPLFFYGLGDRDLWSSHEARSAQNAQGILDGGSWLLPRLFDGRVEMQKPPLFYWTVSVIGIVSGGELTPFLVRLPAALAGLLLVLAVHEVLRRRGRPEAGLLAGVMLSTMLRFTWISRVARIDMPLSFSIGLALMAFYLGCRARERDAWWVSRRWWLLGYFAIAVALLLKGPIGLILVAVGAGAYLLCERRHLGAALLSFAWGLPLVLTIVGPWYWLANESTQGEFAQEFLWRHNLQRGLGGDEQLDSHVHPCWYYLFHLGADIFPWSLVLPWTVWQSWRQRLWRKDAELAFGALWFLGMLFFLSMMKYKRPEYLLPAYPGLAIWFGGYFSPKHSQRGNELNQVPTRWLVPGVVSLAIAMSVGWIVYIGWVMPKLEPARELRSFAYEARQRVPQPGLILIFRVDSHALVYHLGRPTERLWEWENLDIWACQPTKMYVIMPQSWAGQWQEFLEAGRLYPVLTTDDVAGMPHEDKLVLFCTQPP